MCDINHVSLDAVSRLLGRRLLENEVQQAGIGTVLMRCEGPKELTEPVPHIRRADMEVLRQKLGLSAAGGEEQ